MNCNADLISVLRKLIAEETVYLRQYEGTVIDDQDPKSLGRLKIQIPELVWETANTIPWAYPEHGLNTVVPPVGKSAVVYFLKGNRDHPVYRGGTSERADSRLTEYKNPNTVVIFEDDNILFLWDRTEKAFKITINNNEIKFDNGDNLEIKAAVKVTVNAPQVNVTGGQLQINGIVAPNGQGGFCGMPNCAFTGAPQVGNTIANT
ncbi:MAG: phage baseplate assembly protein V [Treponema sp.]|jgi:phage gp45-like|nr:phage baseplate assembly protein V [Treponema sp.]